MSALGSTPEALLQRCAADWHQAGAIAMVGAVGAQLEVDILVEPRAGELEPRDRLQIAGQQRLADAESLQAAEDLGTPGSTRRSPTSARASLSSSAR